MHKNVVEQICSVHDDTCLSVVPDIFAPPVTSLDE